MRKINKFLSMRKAIILSASFLFTIVACKKDGELTPDFVENTSSSEFSNATIIESSTVMGDDVRADNISIGLVGTYKDSAFGTVKSSVYVQPLLNTGGLIFGTDTTTIVMDSIILSLTYSNHFGDTTVAQTFDVFRLTEELSTDESYLSNSTFSKEATTLGSKTFFPTPNTETVISQPNLSGGLDSTTLDAQVRIRLDDALGNDIISKSGQTELLSSENFIAYFNGLQITPRSTGMLNDNENAILYFNLTATNTQMILYYTEIGNNQDTAKKFLNFPINANSVRLNTFEHDYTGSAVETELQNTSVTSAFAYTEAMAGVETVFQFPNLASQFSNKVLINKAELVMPAANGSYAKFGKAASLILARRDEADSLQFIPDFSAESSLYFGGTFDSTSNSYTFNIARYVQSVLNGNTPNDGLTVLVSGSAVKAERVVLNTEDNAGEKVRLNLFYTNVE